MDALRGLMRTDRNQLRQMQLESGGVRQHGLHRFEDERMHHQLAAGRGARQQSAGSLGAMAGELI